MEQGQGRINQGQGGNQNRGAQARITCAPQVAGLPEYRVHVGVDFLKVSFWVDWRNMAFLDLCEMKKQAMQATETEDCLPVSWAGLDWNLSRTGVRLFPYRLQSADIVLLLARRLSSSSFPCVRLEIGSLTSQTNLVQTINKIRSFLSSCGALFVREQVSEVHLAADFIGFDIKSIGIENKDRWISRARQFSLHYEHWNFTGLSLGKGDIMLRCYDKVLELRQQTHKQEIFQNLWSVSRYDEYSVSRVEFQLRRPVLREFYLDSGSVNISTCDDLFSSLGSLWEYCSVEWACFMESSVDRENKHQSRSVLSNFWQAVVNVSWSGIDKLRRVRVNIHKDLIRLRKQILGGMMSVVSYYVDDVYDFSQIKRVASMILSQDFEAFYRSDENEFEKRMICKRNAIVF